MAAAVANAVAAEQARQAAGKSIAKSTLKVRAACGRGVLFCPCMFCLVPWETACHTGGASCVVLCFWEAFRSIRFDLEAKNRSLLCRIMGLQPARLRRYMTSTPAENVANNSLAVPCVEWHHRLYCRYFFRTLLCDWLFLTGVLWQYTE